jgi:hypothetical protein
LPVADGGRSVPPVTTVPDPREARASAHPYPTQAIRHLRPAIAAMEGYTPGEQVRDCIKLNTNECA